ncbi:TPR Domain containing protein [Trichomonas vaginalis G3]|uniref:TPR Domain containing protein n=1 Tax=Trichomonas vaginalis (strain ATCC PRA-98 / G3) TaxID=412133 RepID=A2FC06_TRIV3|nr:tetratricopeptide repeat protein 21-like protein family [Trichomonas vaginalis G3]EAX97552.1 TPR Domain containing protein [Trichomonas vaginalis G3]KAI5488117.1 tetratricopeptide repeat protein 21-like protein family [Trichomonas vaginalis G3]|eukprot:XP_001310482.1 TPR Domain containing protein [Trichomonas vaginalis G3]
MVKLLFERVYYYWRHAMYGHVHILCASFIKNQGSDPQFLIWDALASGAEGKTSAGLATLDKLKSMLQAQLAIAYAKLWIHKQAKMQDFASISEIESTLDGLKNSASASSIIQAAQICWLTRDYETAFNLVQPLTSTQPANKDASALVGWIKLTEGDRNSGRWFDLANSDASVTARNIDPFVIYGKALYFANVNKWQESLASLVQLSGISDFPEANLERARVYLSSRSWELALEAAQEGAGHYVSDAEIHFLTVLYELGITGNLESARNSTKSLCEVIAKYEAENAEYIAHVTQVILGLSWSDRQIVDSLLSLFPRVVASNQENPNIQNVYGRLLIAVGRAKEAVEVLQQAVVLDSENDNAFSGLVNAYILMNNMADAQSQLDFLEAMNGTNGPGLALHTLKQKIARLNRLPQDVDSLLGAMKSHVETVYKKLNTSVQSEGTQYKIQVDRFTDMIIILKLPDFEDAMTEAMEHCSTLDKTVPDPRNGPVCDLIEMMLDFVPGAVPFSYYLAILGYGEGRYVQATKAIQFVLNSHWGYNASHCHLLLAQIRLQMKQFDEAEAALNRAVSFDFGIRSSLRYNMIMAQLCDSHGQYDKAVETATNITKTGEYIAAKSPEKLNVILFIAHVHKRAGNFNAALSTVDDALTNFTEPDQVGQIKLFKASLLAKSDYVPDGLAILDSFDQKSELFSAACKSAAKIYLNILKDKAAYIKCFKQLAEVVPNKTNFLLLGDALINVKRFNEAVECFKKALQDDPRDGQVALHLARAYMIVHAFDDALEAYDHAIKVSNDNKVLLEYCRTMYKLRRYPEAQEIVGETMDNIDPDSADWESVFIYAQFAELMSLIELADGSDENSSEYLSDALKCYDRLTAPNRNDIPGDKMLEVKTKASTLYQKNADALLQQDNREEAIKCLKKAAELDDSSSKASLQLAKLLVEDDKTQEAVEICQQILRTNPKCEEATVILADINSNESIQELQQTFNENPTFFRTLVRLIELCARAGQLSSIPEYLEKCDKSLGGYTFCLGLYEYYMGNPQKAIEHFYSCRNDPDWGDVAHIYIFHIKANPSQKFVWCEEKPLAMQKDIDGAENTLRKFRNAGHDTQMMEATLLLSKNTQETVQQALEIYQSMKSDAPDVLIGMCRCFIRLGQQQQATRYLNSLIHDKPIASEITSYVEAFLMMTYISIKDNILDDAEEYVNKAVNLDKSCRKAWEMMAQIYEKKKLHEEAAAALSTAWELTSKTDCYIGYKLAYNYMKAQQPVEAIKVARVVLKIHQNYPKIKEQILIPCCAQIRP